MKQTILSAQIIASILNEGETEPRTVGVNITTNTLLEIADNHIMDVIHILLEQALPEIHDSETD